MFIREVALLLIYPEIFSLLKVTVTGEQLQFGREKKVKVVSSQVVLLCRHERGGKSGELPLPQFAHLGMTFSQASVSKGCRKNFLLQKKLSPSSSRRGGAPLERNVAGQRS